MRTILTLLFICLFSNAFASDCIQKKVTIDIGSGSIKSAGFVYDSCNKTIKQRLGSYDQHLKYELCIVDENGEKVIKHECIDQTREIAQNIKNHYSVNCGEEGKCYGVATAWARKASNSQDVLDVYRSEGMDVKLLSQAEEGELGFKTVVSILEYGKEDQDLIVFDIGGASFQLSTKNPEGKIEVLNGSDGVESFNKRMKKHFGEKTTYLTESQIKELGKKIIPELKAELETNKALVSKIKSKKYDVIAIGRPMYVGMRYQMDFPQTFHKKQVLETALKFSNKTSQEAHKVFPKIADHFILAAQASLIYVYYIMEATGIEEMTIAVARPTDYLVTLE